jgi:hypothetical protein
VGFACAGNSVAALAVAGLLVRPCRDFRNRHDSDRARQIDLIPDFGADQRAGEGCREAYPSGCRIALIVTDHFEHASIAFAFDRYDGPDRDRISRRTGRNLGGRQPASPIAHIAQQLGPAIAGGRRGQLQLKRLIPRGDQFVAALRHRIGTGGKRKLETRLEMFFVTFAAKGDAHDGR